MDSHMPYTETGQFWTNEKHVHFLNSMEASFVRSMLENDNHHYRHHRLRLDRQLPDTAESTGDSKPPPQNNRNCRAAAGGRIDGRAGRRSRRRPSRPYNSSQDQVVPQMENRAGGDEDERDHPMSSVS